MTREQRQHNTDIIANALANAERFEVGETDDLYIRKEDITREFLALANGYKSCGGDIYIVQTYDLLSVRIDYMYRFNFLLWAMGQPLMPRIEIREY